MAFSFPELRTHLAHGRKIRFGLRIHITLRETGEKAWSIADDLNSGVTDEQIAEAQNQFRNISESIGQKRMPALHQGRRARRLRGLCCRDLEFADIRRPFLVAGNFGCRISSMKTVGIRYPNRNSRSRTGLRIWSAYNESLRQPDDLTVWIGDEALSQWSASSMVSVAPDVSGRRAEISGPGHCDVPDPACCLRSAFASNPGHDVRYRETDGR